MKKSWLLLLVLAAVLVACLPGDPGITPVEETPTSDPTPSEIPPSPTVSHTPPPSPTAITATPEVQVTPTGILGDAIVVCGHVFQYTECPRLYGSLTTDDPVRILEEGEHVEVLAVLGTCYYPSGRAECAPGDYLSGYPRAQVRTDRDEIGWVVPDSYVDDLPVGLEPCQWVGDECVGALP